MREILDGLLPLIPESAVVAGDYNNKIIYCSPLAAEWLSHPATSLLGENRQSFNSHPLFELLQGSEWKTRIGEGETLHQVIDLATEGVTRSIRTRLTHYDNLGSQQYWILVGQDISGFTAPESKAHRIEMEGAIRTISRYMNRVPGLELDTALNLALSHVGEAAEADRSYLFMISDTGTHISNTHEWCAEGINPGIDKLQDLPLDKFTPFMTRLEQDDLVLIPRVDEIPTAEAELKEMLESQGIHSLVCVPIYWEECLKGFVGLDAVKREVPWDEPDIDLLRNMGDILAVTLKRNFDSRKIRESEAKFSHIYNHSPVMMHSIDESGHICNVNDQWLCETGYERNEVIGRKAGFLMTPESAERAFYEVTPRFWREGSVRDVPYEYICKDGSIINVLLNCDISEDLHGNRISLSVVRNVTGQVKANRAIKKSEKALKEAQALAHLGSWELDINNNDLYWSDEIYSIFEIDPKKFSPTYEGFLSAVHPDDRIRVNQAYSTSVANHTPYSLEHRLLMADGRIKHVQERCETFYDEVGNALRSIGTVQDITEHYQQEQKSAELHAMLQALVEATSDAIFVKDIEGRYVLANNATASTIGATKNEIIGADDFKFFPVEIAEQFRANDRNTITLGKNVTYEELLQIDEKKMSYLATKGPLVINGEVRGTFGISRDITTRKQAQQQLAQAGEEWTEAMDQFDDAVYLVDLDNNLLRGNDNFYSMINSTPEEAVGKKTVDLIHKESDSSSCPVCKAKTERREVVITLEGNNANNPLGYPIEVSTKLIGKSGGDPTGIMVSIHDLRHSRKTESSIQLAAKVFSSSLNAILITDQTGIIQQVNPRFSEITGFSQEEAIGKSPNILKSDHHNEHFYQQLWSSLIENGQWEGEIWNRRKNGEVYPIWQSISSVHDASNKVSHYIGTFSDISEQKNSAERIHRLAHYDVLTNLPNRALFNDRFQHALDRAHRSGERVALIFMDLDRFKQINDSLGHSAGDALLSQVAQRLKQQIREDDTIARLGGDEFVISLEEISQDRDPKLVAEKLMRAFDKHFMVQGHELVVTSSIGISIYPTDAQDADSLIKFADMAMYRAKAKGRNNYQFYSIEFSERMMERLVLESELRHAVARDELILHYQPQLDLDSGRLVGVEALIGWNHPERGMVPPGIFIPIAEESGLILDIGEWVLRSACKQAASWIDKGLDIDSVSVNLSGFQIQRGNIVEMVSHILEETNLPAAHLELEILETYIMQHAEQDFSVFNGLRELGVGLAIDDFGTGRSSLGYLKRLPVGKLKIDQSFVMDIPMDSDDMAIIKAIVALAQTMQLTVVAEGVETAEQVIFLKGLGCDLIQGFYFSHPISPEEIEKMLPQVT